jgi:hypothetical protein
MTAGCGGHAAPADAAPAAGCPPPSGAGTTASPQRLPLAPGSVSALATDGRDVFIVYAGGGGERLVRVPRDGGCPRDRPLVAGVSTLLVDAEHVYYASSAEGLARLRKDLTAAPERIGAAVTSPLAGDTANLYFLRGPDVVRLAKSGWQEQRLGTWTGATLVDVDDQAVYVARPTTEQVRDDGTIVRSDGGIRRLAKDGGAASELTTVSAETLAVAGEWLYFTFGSVLARIPRQGGPVTEVGTLALPRGLRAAGSSVYGFGRGYVVGYDLMAPAGSPPPLAIAATADVSALAADSSGVYWAGTAPTAIYHVIH